MFQPLPVLLAFLVVIASGVAQGLLAGRWKESLALKTAVERLDRVPREVGAWKAAEEQPLTAKEQQIGGIAGYRSRNYQHQTTGKVVAVLLVCGRPGPIAAHTPRVCYAGAGFERAQDPVKESIATPADGLHAEFWRERFAKKDAGVRKELRVFWSCNPGEVWTAASEDPRWDFPSAQVLFKLYVSRQVEAEEGGGEPCLDFLHEFLPALQRALFAEADAPRPLNGPGKTP